jgi:glucose/arabinose dehydrogenase
MGMGDGGGNSQSGSTLGGKMLRLDVDLPAPHVPPDNPFHGSTSTLPEIWHFGLRNPWRFSFDRWTGELFIGDVGQLAYEEIDIVSIEQARGADFGWPKTEGTHCYPIGSQCSTAGLILPVFDYNRSYGCSVTGGYRYRGTQSPGFAGAYLYSDWCSGRVWAARENASGVWTTQELMDTPLSIVSFGEDDAGELYVVNFYGDVYRVGTRVPRRRNVRH